MILFVGLQNVELIAIITKLSIQPPKYKLMSLFNKLCKTQLRHPGVNSKTWIFSCLLCL